MYVFISEEEILPGRPMPPECHAELHTDYDGVAVRWGLTHHKDSAADCCQACLDQAKYAKEGDKKCNIWVYCPSEFGCYSPDIYQHKHQECWLKYVSSAWWPSYLHTCNVLIFFILSESIPLVFTNLTSVWLHILSCLVPLANIVFLIIWCQAEKPRLNFKDKYPESYRNSHPTAPVIVPWASGVVGAWADQPTPEVLW